MAILVKGQDFADGEQITATKLDNLVDNATFASGAVETGGGVQLNGSGQLKVAGNIDIGTSNLTATGTISLGTTSFNDNNITNVGSIALDTITNDGTDVTIDSSGDIILDADGAQIRIKDAGTERFIFNTDATPELDVLGGDFTIHANTSDADIILTGNDGGSTITALTLDMSAAGAATFNDKITATELDISGDISVTGSVKQSGNTGNLILKGGDTDGANIELYGASSSQANKAFYDAITHSFRPEDGSSNRVVISSSGLTASGDLTVDTTTLKVDSTNNRVGIGTASPTMALHVVGAGTITAGLNVGIDNATAGSIHVFGGANSAAEGGEIRLYNHADADGSYDFWRLDSDTNGFFRLGRAGQTDLTIDHDGYVGVGTSNADKALVVAGVGAEIVIDDTDTTDTPRLRFRESGATSGGISTDAGELLFDTGTTTRMRIDSSGNVGINNTNPTVRLEIGDGSGTSDHVYHNKSGSGAFPGITDTTSHGIMLESQGSNGSTLHVSRTNSAAGNFSRQGTGDVVTFHNTSSSVTEAGSIEITGSTSVAYQTSSDYRLKENVADIVDGIDRVKQLNPVKFNFIDEDRILDGFIAHEVSDIVPEAIGGEKDAMKDQEYEISPAVYEDVVHPAVDAIYDEDGTQISLAQEGWTERVLVTEAVIGTRSVPDYQGIDQSKLVPLLTAALQEAVAKIEALEARVATLEG